MATMPPGPERLNYAAKPAESGRSVGPIQRAIRRIARMFQLLWSDMADGAAGHRRNRRRLIVPIAALVLTTAVIIYLWMPFQPVGKPLVIDTLQLPDGQTLSLMQMRTDSWTEPYMVQLFWTGGNGAFWYYIAHEDFYWRRGRLNLNEDGVSVSLIRNGREVGVFDTTTNMLRLPHRVSSANECDERELDKWNPPDVPRIQSASSDDE